MERSFRNLKTERLNNITFINHASAVDEVEVISGFIITNPGMQAWVYTTPPEI
jgi:hypothetical protein